MHHPDTSTPAERIHLWGLVQAAADRLPGDDTLKTFYIRLDGGGGVLAFASALDAEIYRCQLEASGLHGWRRAPLEHIDLDRVMSGLAPDRRRLMLALGFSASDTNDLLLDEYRTLVTPLLPIAYRMQHSLHGMSRLLIRNEVCGFIEQWWDQVGGERYAEQVRLAGQLPGHELERWAGEALAKAAVADLRQYHQRWSETGSGDECAVFSPQHGAWHFSTLSGRRSRALH